MYTLNDNVTGYVADVLIAAHHAYDDDRYEAALRRLGDFLVLAQMPSPQPGWAQQYDYEMRPIWARKFEPPAIASDETMEVIDTLMQIADLTGEKKYLEPIPAAAKWLNRSRLPDGQFARYYELSSNRPLYMNRTGKQYHLTYDDSDLPDHYGWKIDDRTAALGRMFNRAKAGIAPHGSPSPKELAARAKQAIESLDDQGRWISRFDGQRLVGQAKMPVGTEYLSSAVFGKNMLAICDHLDATK